jgi:hypothetical protein
MLCELVYYHSGLARFPHFTFQVAFFVPHPADVSDWLNKDLECLTFRSKFTIQNTKLKIIKMEALLSLDSIPVCFFDVRWSRTLPLWGLLFDYIIVNTHVRTGNDTFSQDFHHLFSGVDLYESWHKFSGTGYIPNLILQIMWHKDIPTFCASSWTVSEKFPRIILYT